MTTNLLFQWLMTAHTIREQSWKHNETAGKKHRTTGTPGYYELGYETALIKAAGNLNIDYDPAEFKLATYLQVTAMSTVFEWAKLALIEIPTTAENEVLS